MRRVFGAAALALITAAIGAGSGAAWAKEHVTLDNTVITTPPTDPAASHCFEGQEVNKINGFNLPGTLAPLVDTSVMLDAIDDQGMQVKVLKGTRRAGTRVGIHVHQWGGHTCVFSGAITIFVEGQAPRYAPAGTCYYMPSCVPMAAANLGTEDAVLTDTFVVPPGQPVIHILEHGY